ncbi:MULTISPECIES: hypothetical protein [Rhodomicrobium]|uniref:hypothetical protein n=1 Tax=Rhodomicrobium TaxID=1068 RepID=UPI000B4B2C4C|nr:MULTISPECIES: hypothetical protein [Rhodomicrobium]
MLRANRVLGDNADEVTLQICIPAAEAWYKAVIAAKMPARAKLICCMLVQQTSDRGDFITPSFARLCANVAMDRRTVKKHAEFAKRAGLIEITAGPVYRPLFREGGQ